MGTWKLQSDVWACPCGSSTIVEHSQDACHEGDENVWVWTTRDQRMANPNLKQCRVQQCVWIGDDTWMTCEGCKRDLNAYEVAKVNAYKRTIDWSKMVIHETIGIAVINDYAVAKVEVNVEENMKKSKMYIIVKDSIPNGIAAVAIAHASLSGYLHFVEIEKQKWLERDRHEAFGGKADTELWAEQSFRKVVCSATQAQFDEAKSFGVIGEDFRVITESSLDGAEVAIVFRPRTVWEQFFKSLPLWGRALIGCPTL